jgi:hypothetical protein
VGAAVVISVVCSVVEDDEFSVHPARNIAASISAQHIAPIKKDFFIGVTFLIGHYNVFLINLAIAMNFFAVNWSFRC